jgi:hypothetical protein
MFLLFVILGYVFFVCYLRLCFHCLLYEVPLNVRKTTVCPSFKNLLSNSQTLRQCYFYMLWKRCRSVWEFDNNYLNDGHIVVYRPFRGIWCTITFNVILTITNVISKNLPSSGTKWLPIMTYIHHRESVTSQHWREIWKMSMLFENRMCFGRIGSLFITQQWTDLTNHITANHNMSFVNIT